jgi:hypothetical protein
MASARMCRWGEGASAPAGACPHGRGSDGRAEAEAEAEATALGRRVPVRRSEARRGAPRKPGG